MCCAHKTRQKTNKTSFPWVAIANTEHAFCRTSPSQLEEVGLWASITDCVIDARHDNLSEVVEEPSNEYVGFGRHGMLIGVMG